VIAALAGVTSFNLSSSVTAEEDGATLGPISLAGTAQAPATLSTLPAITATGTATGGFPIGGTGGITAPATPLVITPEINTVALAAITCSPTTAGSVNVKVTVTEPTAGTSGPLYACVLAAGAISVPQNAHINATMTASGSKTTGSTDTVSYTNDQLGSLIQGVSSAQFSASLPVTGAQTGKIILDQPLSVTAANPTVSGTIKLTAAGTDQILIPQEFTVTATVSATQATVIHLAWAAVHAAAGATVTVKCTLTTSSPPTGLTLSVTQGPGSPQGTASPKAPTNPGGQPQGSGFPSGAPETGGGVGSAANVAVVAGGIALAAAGGGLALVAWRRRRGDR
jgi:hypothetical protein